MYYGLKRMSMFFDFFYKIITGLDKKNAALRQHFNVEIIGFEPTTL